MTWPHGTKSALLGCSYAMKHQNKAMPNLNSVSCFVLTDLRFFVVAMAEFVPYKFFQGPMDG